MKIKTYKLEGIALDWAVAMAEGATCLRYDGIACYWFTLNGTNRVLGRGWSASQNWHPSTNWAQAGLLIEREGISWHCGNKSSWHAYWYGSHENFTGQTPLIAAMRCYVASKLGNEVNIPEEFL